MRTYVHSTVSQIARTNLSAVNYAIFGHYEHWVNTVTQQPESRELLYISRNEQILELNLRREFELYISV